MTSKLLYLGEDGALHSFSDLPSGGRVRLVLYMGGSDLQSLSAQVTVQGAIDTVLFAEQEMASKVCEELRREKLPARVFRVTVEELKDDEEHS